MQTIVDKFGNNYNFEITLGRPVEELNSECNVNLLEADESSDRINSMLTSIARSIDAIWCLVKHDAMGREVPVMVTKYEDKTVDEAEGVSKKIRVAVQEESVTEIKSQMDFLDLFTEVEISKAMDQLGHEIMGFIQKLSPQTAMLVQKQIEKSKKLRAIQVEKVSKAIDSQKIDQMAEQQMDRAVEEAMKHMETQVKANTDRALSDLSKNMSTDSQEKSESTPTA